MVAAKFSQAPSALAGRAGLRDQTESLATRRLLPRPAHRSRQQSSRAGVARAAVMAPQDAVLKTYKASEMSAEDLLQATARPRIDFASILSTVGCRRHACLRAAAARQYQPRDSRLHSWRAHLRTACAVLLIVLLSGDGSCQSGQHAVHSAALH